MFGNNPSRRQVKDDGQRLWIQEIFYTLQGEGPFSGQPAIFVRLAGCNLRCFWCDTDFESSRYEPELPELLQRISALCTPDCDLVVVTGGEPLRQNIAPLLQQLLDQGYRVQIETSGSLALDLPASARLTVVCSPKTAKLHPRLIDQITTYKYVLAADEIDPDDGLPVMSTQKQGERARIARPPEGASVYVMPRDDGDAEKNERNRRASAEVAMRFGYTLCLQTHKLLGMS